MKILKLEAENFKKLKAVEITPTGELVQITGRNGAGKSSVLDAIWAALGGAKHIQSVPIRKGADKARIRLDLGELIVERRFSAGGQTTLTVENAEGARYKTPQAMLDALLGALTFDPLAFVGEQPRGQFETLRRIVPLEIDLDQLDGLNRRDFDARTEINREARKLRAQADGISVQTGLPSEPLDVAALKDQMALAGRRNTEIEKRRANRERATQDADEARKRAADKRATIGELRTSTQEQITQLRARLDQQVTRLEVEAKAAEDGAAVTEAKLAQAEPLPEPEDVDAIRAELDAAEATNQAIDQARRKQDLAAEAERMENQAAELTGALERREQVKAEAMARAPMPVPGLGFGDGVVTFGGIPFDQASTAEQLRVSVAIAMAANPKLRVIRIKEGSALDAENIALIAEMAKAQDYSIWIERVDSSGKVGVYIEDGQVVAVDGEKIAQPAGEPG